MKKFFTFVAAAFAAMTINAQAISVADAITAGMALDSAATSEADYTIEGYVVNAQPYSLSYDNQIWYMADDAANTANQEFQAYGCVAIENNDTLQVLNGDKVQLTGKLFKYYNKSAAKYVIEVKDGAAVFVTKADGDHTIDKGVEQLTVAQALAIGNDLAIGATSTKTYEITGYVTALAGKDTDFDQYGNQTYWIADAQGTAASNAEGAFEVYRGVADQAVAVGYKVKVKTAIKKYNDGSATGLIESETKAAVTILEGGDITPVEEADVVFLPADFEGQGQAATQETPGGAVSTTKGGVTVSTDNGYGHNLALRVYKGGRFAITSSEQQIGKVVFKFYSTYNGGLDDEVVVNDKEFVVESMTTQARIEKISIYFGEYEKPEVEPITVAEALQIAQALTPEKGKSTTTVEKYAVKGFVVGISTKNENTFYLADEAGAYGEFEAYKCSSVDYEVAEGDLVIVTGKIQHYWGEGSNGEFHSYEISGGTLVHVYGQGIENVTLTEKANKVMVDGVLYIVRDGKMFNVQGTQVR